MPFTWLFERENMKRVHYAGIPNSVRIMLECCATHYLLFVIFIWRCFFLSFPISLVISNKWISILLTRCAKKAQLHCNPVEVLWNPTQNGYTFWRFTGNSARTTVKTLINFINVFWCHIQHERQSWRDFFMTCLFSCQFICMGFSWNERYTQQTWS